MNTRPQRQQALMSLLRSGSLKVKLRKYVNYLRYHSHMAIIGFADVRSTISGGPHPREHDMASQVRHLPIQNRAKRLASRVIEAAHAYTRDGSQTITRPKWCAPMGVRDASRPHDMYTRRTCHERVRIRATSTALWENRNCPNARTSHLDSRGCTRAGAHVVRLHDQLRTGILARTSRLGGGRAPTRHPRRCTPRQGQLAERYDGRLCAGCCRWETAQGIPSGGVFAEI
jgi:hypothetical protein